jgi:ADP-ribose pyrophosphatase
MQLQCTSCGSVTHAHAAFAGPAVLILVLLFAEGKLLLLKRGQSPYIGKWAPPGGFVEEGESLERAAAREVEEEVGIKLREEQLLPQGIQSLPALNQVYVTFLATLPQAIAPSPSSPEALDAQWFSQSDYSRADLWEPAVGFDIAPVYDSVRLQRFDFYHFIADAFRVITAGYNVDLPWHKR